jgi:hypothetical protein
MTRFEDGPAKGQTLMLKRSPQFLRVAEAGGKWDALDQFEDTPEPGEKLHAYERHGEAGGCHIRASGGRSGFYTVASYRHCAEQPAQEQMRDQDAWRDWCREQQQKGN